MPKVRRILGNRASASAYGAIESLEARVLFARALGIDVSHWQGTINWTSVKSVKDFAIIKATGSDSNDYTDSKYTANRDGATAAGMLYGVYHFAYPDSATSAAAQADFFYSKGASSMTAGHLPPVLDLESGTSNSTTISNWANAFCTELYVKSGVKPIIYTSSGTYATYLNSSVTSQWQLWVANYGSSNGAYTDTSAAVQTGAGPSNGNWPAGSWKFWQYNSVGSVSGISGNVDSDVYHGTVAELQSMVVTAPEITVTQGATAITDGQAGSISFGTASTGAANPTLSFTVKNDGGSLLTLGTPTLPAGYSFTADMLVTSLAAGQSDTFGVQFSTASVGTFSGNISFTNNDASENPFNFPVTGSITSPLPPAPTSFAASDSLYSDHVALSWNAASGAVNYQLYRSTTNDPATATLLAQTSSTTFDDFSASPNTTYCYWAASINSGNVTGNKGTSDAGASDSIAPTVAGKSFQNQFGPPYLSFTFSEAVGVSINTASLMFDNLDQPSGNVPGVMSIQWIAASKTARFFLSAAGLPDGNFRATLTGVRDPANNALTGAISQDFYFLRGDATADRVVNALDFNALASHYGYAGAGFAGGDFDYSGSVTSADFTSMADRWATSLPPSAQPLGAVVQPASLFSSTRVADSALLEPDAANLL